MEQLEAVVERRLIKQVNGMGGVCWKLAPTSRRGIPDRLAVLPGMIGFVELKRPGEKKSEAQEMVHKMLAALRCNVVTLGSTRAVDQWAKWVREELDA
jgi:hypothetical protein